MTEIILQDNIIIQCPLKEFAFRKASKCLICQHHQGMAKATERGEYVEGNEADDFMVICGKPVTRRMNKIESD